MCGIRFLDLDASLSSVSKKSLLAFEAIGTLQHALDCWMDLYLKAWDPTLLNLKLGPQKIIEFLFTQLKAHLDSGSHQDYF